MGSHRKTIIAAAVPVGFLLSGALIWQASYAAFSDTETSSANSWQAGSVDIALGTATAMFSESGLVPGATGEKCMTVTYNGDVDADVALYAAAAGATDLAPYLNLTIGIGTASDASCSGWVESSSLFADTAAVLLATNTDFASGLTGWSPLAGSGESVVYRFAYELDAATPDGSQGDSAAIDFTWESHNS